MGFLIDGVIYDDMTSITLKNGVINRASSNFRSKISKDGSTGFPAVAGRYHLYVSFACPWACRALIVKRLKNLDDKISISIVDPHMLKLEGWQFTDGPGCIPDFINNKKYLHEIYLLANPKYSGRCTVPVLWDKETKTIINNESTEICQMFNSEFHSEGTIDLYPEHLQKDIDWFNHHIYESLNNGVYKAGMNQNQEAYEKIVRELFRTLDMVDERLSHNRYIHGDALTLSDIYLFTTLVRFDLVYYTHFKCCLRHLYDYHNLLNFVRDFYQLPGMAELCNLEHIKLHYYKSHYFINPWGIVPVGPGNIDYSLPHDRGKFSSSLRSRSTEASRMGVPELAGPVNSVRQLQERQAPVQRQPLAASSESKPIYALVLSVLLLAISIFTAMVVSP